MKLVKTAVVAWLVLVAACTRPARPGKTIRHYAGTMMAVDAAVFATFVPAARWALDHQSNTPRDAVAMVYVAAYLAGGPLVHMWKRNDRQVERSLGRRLVYPVAVGLVGGGILRAAQGNCAGLEGCGSGFWVGGLIGVGVGAVAAAIHDWTTASVEVPETPPAATPIVTVDGDRVVVGLGGRF